MKNNPCSCIVFSDRAYNDIIVETQKKNPLETGGILLGYVLDDVWIVMEVLPPGPSSTFQYAYFEYDVNFVNYLADSVATEYDQTLSLLGLWHRHPGSMDTFSGTDDGTNSTFADLTSVGAISGLVNVDPVFRLTMYHVSNPLHYTKVDVEVGDDLIPEKYFKLKYPSSETLNPKLHAVEKKKESKIIGNLYGNDSRTLSPKSDADIKSKSGFNVKCILYWVAALLITISLCMSFAYHKMGESDAKALHKVVCPLSPSGHIADSIQMATKVDKSAEIKTIYYNGLSTEEAIADVKCNIWLSWILSILLLLTALCISNRKCIILIIRKIRKQGAWFEWDVKLFEKEDAEIRKRFSNIEKSLEADSLSYFICSDKNIVGQANKLSFMLTYSDDYDKDKQVFIYFINPELEQLLNDEIDGFPYISTDSSGSKYLNLSGTLDKKQVSGMEVIRQMYKWLHLYEQYYKKQVSKHDFKI